MTQIPSPVVRFSTATHQGFAFLAQELHAILAKDLSLHDKPRLPLAKGKRSGATGKISLQLKRHAG